MQTQPGASDKHVKRIDFFWNYAPTGVTIIVIASIVFALACWTQHIMALNTALAIASIAQHSVLKTLHCYWSNAKVSSTCKFLLCVCGILLTPAKQKLSQRCLPMIVMYKIHAHNMPHTVLKGNNQQSVRPECLATRFINWTWSITPSLCVTITWRIEHTLLWNFAPTVWGTE